MVNRQLYNKTVNNFLETFRNVETLFGSWQNLASLCLVTRKSFPTLRCPKNYDAIQWCHRNHVFKKFLKIPSWLGCASNKLIAVSWINAKRDMEVPNTYYNVRKRFKIFELLSGSNQGIKESINVFFDLSEPQPQVKP